MLLEQYAFPHLYQLRKTGERYAKLQLTRQLTFRQWIECESDVSRWLPSYTFNIYDHPRDDINVRWWVIAVQHEGKQPGVLEHESPDERGLEYKSCVTAIPEMTRFVPELEHPKVRIIGLQSAIVTGPDGEEVYTDEYGRVKVQFHWDREGQYDEKTTCWVRVADTWAGANFGFIQVPRIGQEVMVEFMEGDPDRPVITGRVYNAALMPPWRLPEQKTLSGIQSREFQAARRNQLMLDDTQGQIQAQLSSDHDLSQLSLGYLTRINHVEGRKDFRGEGFELRTDGWGVIRAAKGLVLTAEGKKSAGFHQKDLREPSSSLADAASLHADAVGLAVTHNVQDEAVEATPVKEAVSQQNKAIVGSGKPHSELQEPHLLLSGPAGIELSTPKSTHLQSGAHTVATSTGHTSIVAGKNILGTALQAIHLFAHKLGVKLFAGQGKVEIQAQSDDLDIIAQKVLHLISTTERIEITAAKEIMLNADSSYLKVSGRGIEIGTRGQFTVRSGGQSYEGPDSQTEALPSFPESAVRFNDRYIVCDPIIDEPIEKMRYEIIYPNGSRVTGTTGKDGKIPMQEGLVPEMLIINLLGKEE